MRFIYIALLAMTATLAHAEMKIAVVDMQRAVLSSDQAKVAVDKFRAAKQGDIDTITQLEKELKGIQEKMSTSADFMSEEERRKMKATFDEKASTYQFHRQNMQKAEQQELQSLAQLMEPKMQKALKTIIEDSKYDLVLRPEAVIYSTGAIDITKQLLEKMNESK